MKFALSLSLSLSLLAIGALALPNGFYKPSINEKYYYQRLESDQMRMYDVLEIMLNNGFFDKENGSYNIFESGKFSMIEITLLTNDKTSLLKKLRAAEDAFSHDYNDLFFINFDNLGLGVSSKDGSPIISFGDMGKGSFYRTGFTPANRDNLFKQYIDEVEKIVAEAKKESSVKAQIQYCYQAIEKKITFKYEETATGDKKNYVRTPYALLTGEALCEGYSRTLKACLDRLGVENILIQGLLDGQGRYEQHMWNYIHDEQGRWYGFDVTVDDTLMESSNLEDGLRYFYGTEEIMGVDHFPDGASYSDAEYEFTLPMLYSLNSPIGQANSNLSIQRRGERIDVSYKGMGWRKCYDQGIFWLIKYDFYGYPKSTVFNYILPEDLMMFEFPDYDDHIELIMAAQIEYISIKITEKHPGPNIDKYFPDWEFHGDESDIIEQLNDVLVLNEGEGYIAPPYIKKITPSQYEAYYYTGTNKISATYDVDLELDGTPLWVEQITANDYVNSTTFTKDVKFIAPKTIEFTWVSSEYYGSDGEVFNFNIHGVVGKLSKKEPNPVGYIFQFPSNFGCCFKKKLFSFGKAKKMEDDSILHENGAYTKEELEARGVEYQLAMTVEANGKKEAFMLALNICSAKKKKMSSIYGHQVYFYFGFADGYYPTSGLHPTYKGYHWKQGADGLFRMQPLEIVETANGLEAVADSF